MKDHEIAQLVNQVTETAKKFHDFQQLRQNISNLLVPVLKTLPHQHCKTHGAAPLNVWACPECLVMLRDENKALRTSVAELDGLRAENKMLQQSLEEAVNIHHAMFSTAREVAADAVKEMRAAAEYLAVEGVAPVLREKARLLSAAIGLDARQKHNDDKQVA